MGGGIEGILYIFATLRMAISMFVIYTSTTISGTRTTTGSTTIGMTTTPRRCTQIFSFLSRYLLSGEFFFAIILPFQPPKSLPIEFNFSESVIYLFSSKDFVSQRIFKNIFKTSDFLIANFIYGTFSSGFKKLATDTDSIISIKILSTFCPNVYL